MRKLLAGAVLFVALPAALANDEPAAVASLEIAPVHRIHGDAYRPEHGDTYIFGETIHIRVRFTRAVLITGWPQLELMIGGEPRTLTDRGDDAVDGWSYETDEIWFYYDVQKADVDLDGIGIEADALQGTIADASGVAAVLDLGRYAVENAHEHKVDGRIDYVPRAVASVSSWPPGDVYGVGDAIDVTVGFGESVTFLGEPVFALTVGETVRPMRFAGCMVVLDAPTIGKGPCHAMHFTYTVQAGDYDADGIEIPADAFASNVATIHDDGGNYAILELSPANFPDQRVDGRRPLPTTISHVSFGSYPQRDRIYTHGEAIRVTIDFHRRVQVNGRPSARLRIGDAVRDALFADCIHLSAADGAHGGGPCDRLVFEYVVQPQDQGERIDVLAVAPNGGAIADEYGIPADLTVRRDPTLLFSPTPVNGDIDRAPSVDNVRVDGFRTIYRVGETVRVVVRFDEVVLVAGSPYLFIAIGDEQRQADYAGCLYEAHWQGCVNLWFDYVVQPADHDPDGIAIAPQALDLNGGAIHDRSGYAANVYLEEELVRGAGEGRRVDGAPAGLRPE